MKNHTEKLFFTAHDLWKIPDYAHLTRSGIYSRYRTIKNYYNKTHRAQQLTYQEAAAYLGLDEFFLRQIVQQN